MRSPIEVRCTPEGQRLIADTKSKLRRISLVIVAKGRAVRSAIVTPVDLPVLEDKTPPTTIPVEVA